MAGQGQLGLGAPSLLVLRDGQLFQFQESSVHLAPVPRQVDPRDDSDHLQPYTQNKTRQTYGMARLPTRYRRHAAVSRLSSTVRGSLDSLTGHRRQNRAGRIGQVPYEFWGTWDSQLICPTPIS